MELAFGFDAGCNGNCDPGSIPENLAKAFDGFKEMAGRPNLNTGDPAKDAVRATVETLADQQLTNGKALALRITYSPEIMASGPYQAEMRLMCAWHQPGDPWYVQLSVRAAQKQGEEALPTLLDVCKSVEVLGPTPNEAEKQPAQTFTGERLALAALPPSAYSVESKNSEGQPAAILLKQPVVYNGLPIAPIAKIYLDYGDEPTTFRDIFTTKDHTFTVAGASVVCLRRQPLSVRPDGGLHRCMLAQDTKVGEWMFKAYGEVSFEAQRPRSGVLKDQVSFPEATCQAASKVEFDAADGGLTRCTLGQPLVKEGLSVPIGAEVRWKGVARIDRIEIPKEAVLQVGTDSYTGPGQARFKQGVFLEWRAGK